MESSPNGLNSSGLPRCQLMYASPEPFRNHHRHDVWMILFAITMVLSNEEPIMGDTAYGNAMYGTEQCVQTCLSHHFEIIVNEAHQLASLDSIRVNFWKLCPWAFGIRWRNDAQCILMHFLQLFHLFRLVGRVSSRIWCHNMQAS